ncbi:MAG: hypothetical protein ACLQU1_00900 [Bryobacteraceae bacterium]
MRRKKWAPVFSPRFAPQLRFCRTWACWLAALAASVLAWQYRNVAYLLPMTPALAIAAAAYGPFPAPRTTGRMLALALAALAAKAAALPIHGTVARHAEAPPALVVHRLNFPAPHQAPQNPGVLQMHVIDFEANSRVATGL